MGAIHSAFSREDASRWGQRAGVQNIGGGFMVSAAPQADRIPAARLT